MDREMIDRMYETRVSPYGHTGITFRSHAELREFIQGHGFTVHSGGWQKQIPEGVVIATSYADRHGVHLAIKTVERLQYRERRFAA